MNVDVPAAFLYVFPPFVFIMLRRAVGTRAAGSDAPQVGTHLGLDSELQNWTEPHPLQVRFLSAKPFH